MKRQLNWVLSQTSHIYSDYSHYTHGRPRRPWVGLGLRGGLTEAASARPPFYAFFQTAFSFDAIDPHPSETALPKKIRFHQSLCTEIEPKVSELAVLAAVRFAKTRTAALFSSGGL